MNDITTYGEHSLTTHAGSLREMREALTIQKEGEVATTWLETRSHHEKHLHVCVEQQNSDGDWSRTTLNVDIS